MLYAPRTCRDEHADPLATPAGSCPLCDLYRNSAEYRDSWDEADRQIARGEQPWPPAPRPADLALPRPGPCRHLGPATGEERTCPSCLGTVRLKLFACALHTACTPAKQIEQIACCATCADYQPPAPEEAVFVRFVHGLGDAVAFTAVLAHLRVHRPSWRIDLAAPAAHHPLFAGKVRALLPPDAAPAGHAKAFDLAWQEGHGLDPSLAPTKAARCLAEVFGIRPERELLCYAEPAATGAAAVDDFLGSLPARRGVVAVHGEGEPWGAGQRDLPAGVVLAFCAHLQAAGYAPVVLDRQGGLAAAAGGVAFPGTLGVGQLSYLLSRTALNVMIDSGPQKLALAARTPLLCVWRMTHPVHYVDRPDLPPGAVHLVPADHADYLEYSAGVRRDCKKGEALAFFRANFRHATYDDLGAGLCAAADFLLGRGGDPPAEPTGGAVTVSTAPPAADAGARKLLLATGLPPGDVTTLTAAVHCLHEQFPGQYLTAVDTPWGAAVWENNPHVVLAGPDFERVQVEYHAVHESGNRPVHFLSGYAEFLAQNLRIPLRLTTNRPHLYLSDEEKGWMNQVREATGSAAPYWVLNAGVKRDYPAKQYPFFQEVVDLLRHRVRFAQVGHTADLHRPLRGVVDLLDRTGDRALIRLVYHAQGVLCGVTWLMHLAAAFEKPGVVVAGGREPRLWNSYPTQTLLATVGSLDCCRTGGCWRSRVTPEQNDGKADGLCERPMPTDPPAGECMTRISPELVARAVESYLP